MYRTYLTASSLREALEWGARDTMQDSYSKQLSAYGKVTAKVGCKPARKLMNHYAGDIRDTDICLLCLWLAKLLFGRRCIWQRS